MEENSDTSIKNGWIGNLIKRTLTGVPALAILLLLIAFAHWVVLGFFILLAGIYGIYEYRNLLAGEPGIELPFAPLMASATLIGLGGIFGGVAGLTITLALSAVILMASGLRSKQTDHLLTLRNTSLSLFGLIWIPWFFGHLNLILQLPDGNGLLMYLLLVLTFNDTFAYLTGSLFGKRLLLPAVSPKKTLEGSLGGLAGGVLGGFIATTWLSSGQPGYPLFYMLGFSVVLGLLGQAGDLLESMVKRAAGASDSGTFLPGHGGFLDRMDSFLLAPPFMYYFLTFIS